MNNSIRLKKNRKVLMRIIILQLQVASQPLDFVLDKVKQKRIEFNFYHTCTNMQVVQVMYKRHSLWPVGWQRNATVMHEHQCYPHIQNTQKVQLVSFRDARTTNSFFLCIQDSESSLPLERNTGNKRKMSCCPPSFTWHIVPYQTKAGATGIYNKTKL